MPLYEYQCPQCGRFELIQKFSDPPLTSCPTCSSEVEKLLSAPAIQFKGTGWYVTDYARKSSDGGGGAKGESSKGDGAKGESAKSDGAKSEGGKSESAKSSDTSTSSGTSSAGSAGTSGSATNK